MMLSLVFQNEKNAMRSRRGLFCHECIFKFVYTGISSVTIRRQLQQRTKDVHVILLSLLSQ